MRPPPNAARGCTQHAAATRRRAPPSWRVYRGVHALVRQIVRWPRSMPAFAVRGSAGSLSLTHRWTLLRPAGSRARPRARLPGSFHHVVKEGNRRRKQTEEQRHRLRHPLPQRERHRDLRVGRQATVEFGLGDVVEHVDDVRAADRRRVVDAGILEAGVVTKLPGASISQRPQIRLRAELEAACRTRLDARRLEPLSDAIGAERALVHLLRQAVELRDVERTTRDAVLAPDAVLLLEIDDAIGVLDDGAVGGTGAKAARIFAVHALILAHEPLERSVRALVLVELDEIPEIPRRRRHRLVGVVECRLLEWHVVPFDARDLAGLAADARGDVYVLADLILPLHAGARDASGVTRNLFDLQRASGHRSGLLDLHKEPLELRRVGVGIDDRRREKIRRRQRGPARILGNPAVAPMDRDADLIRLLPVNLHRPDATGHQ